MTRDEIVSMAASQVGYHEKETSTPTAALYPFQNSYDGTDNWTKFHHELEVGQGTPWCGYFAYWVFWSLLGKNKTRTNNFLHGIDSLGSYVSAWMNAFASAGAYFAAGTYQPQIGDVVLFADTGIPYSHVEIVVDTSGWPSYINTIGGNTKQTSGGSGTEAESAWVARRSRSATATTGFHIIGYCAIDAQSGTSGGPLILKRRRIGTAFG